MAAAAFMLAHQVAGKAARDALFLAQFTPRDLPKMVVAGALAAILLSFAFSRFLALAGPRKVVPLAFLLSAALHAGEWMAMGVLPEAAAVAVYLHIVGLGAILLAGFWALASELFDPREAKVRFGRIAGTGTAGGIVGGLLAERTAAWFSSSSVLLLLAAFHLAAGAILWRLHREGGGERHQAEASPSRRDVFRRAPFLWSLATMVLLGTTSAAMLDYLFKSGAVLEFGGKSPSLLRYFALFYTGAQVLTFLVQTVVSRWSLEKLGLSRTVGSLPFAVGAGSAIALIVPMFPAIASVRALELILRGSLFRAGYEIFYTPIAARDKRAVKVLIDVGFDRMGDAAGAFIVQLAFWMGPALARTELLAATIALAVVTAWIASRLDKAYTGVLERGLIDRAVELDFSDIHDSTTMSVVMRTMPRAGAAMAVSQGAAGPARGAAPEARAGAPGAADATLQLLTALRSGNAARVKTALDDALCGDLAVTPQLIRLLAWDEVSEAVQQRLIAMGPRIVGQLSDALLDAQEDFAIRRRTPRLLARAGHSPRAAAALVEALDDSRFEVRFQSGRALDALRQRSPDLALPEARIWTVIERDLSASESIWASHRLLDQRGANVAESDEKFMFMDELLRERANLSLEHVFSLLALVLPREPLKVAFRALHTDDRQIRGLALEYLESVLPAGVRAHLWSVVDGPPPAPGSATPQEVVDRLMLSQHALSLRLPLDRSKPSD